MTKFKIEQGYRYYVVTETARNGKESKAKIPVKVYFINHIPFTFDQLTELELNDPLVLDECASHNDLDEIYLYQSSDYLIAEECHPCLFEVELENPQDMPVDQ